MSRKKGLSITVAQLVGVVLVLVSGHDAVEALDDELHVFVEDVGLMAVIAQARDEALGEADAAVELVEDA